MCYCCWRFLAASSDSSKNILSLVALDSPDLFVSPLRRVYALLLLSSSSPPPPTLSMVFCLLKRWTFLSRRLFVCRTLFPPLVFVPTLSRRLPLFSFRRLHLDDQKRLYFVIVQLVAKNYRAMSGAGLYNIRFPNLSLMSSMRGVLVSFRCPFVLFSLTLPVSCLRW